MAASPQDLLSSQSPHSSTHMYTMPKEAMGPSLRGSLPDCLPPHGPSSEPGSNTCLWGGECGGVVFAGSNPQPGVVKYHLSHLQAGEWRTELGVHPATGQAHAKWKNTDRSGVFQSLPTPSSQLNATQKQRGSGWEGKEAGNQE